MLPGYSIKKKMLIKGNTFIEVLIGLLIVSLAASIASSIFLNIHKNNSPFSRLKAIEIAESYMNKVLDEKNFENDKIKLEGTIVTKQVIAHPQYNDLLVIRVLVSNEKNRKIYELESVVKVDY